MSQLLREARLGTSHSHPDFGILASKETRRSQSPVKLPGKAQRVRPRCPPGPAGCRGLWEATGK